MVHQSRREKGLSFLRKMAANRAGQAPVTPDYDLKIVMVGSISVGKTSLVCRFVKDTFRDHLTTTIGASYMFKVDQVDGATVKYSLWDTAGQEQFHSLVPMYFREADGVVMVVDAGRPGSVHEEVRLWLDKVRQAAPPTISVVIAVNKCDLPGADEAEFAAGQIAKEMGFVTARVSAKTGEGVQLMYRKLAAACIVRRNGGSPASAGLTSAKSPSTLSAGGSSKPGETENEEEDEVGGRTGTARRTGSSKFKLNQVTGGKQPKQQQRKCCLKS